MRNSGVGINIGKAGALGPSPARSWHAVPLRGALVELLAARWAVSQFRRAGDRHPADAQPAAELPADRRHGLLADSASVMPPQPGYTSSGFGPEFGSRVLASAGQLGAGRSTGRGRQWVTLATLPPRRPRSAM